MVFTSVFFSPSGRVCEALRSMSFGIKIAREYLKSGVGGSQLRYQRSMARRVAAPSSEAQEQNGNPPGPREEDFGRDKKAQKDSNDEVGTARSPMAALRTR